MVSETIMRILAECTVQDNTIHINSGQLDRKTYEGVNSVLDALGGKWNRKAKGHICTYDPSDALASVVSTGEVPDKNPLAYFPTTQPVIEKMLGDIFRFGVQRIRTILEPSAGDGAIVASLRERIPENIKIVAVEIDQQRTQQLRDRNLPNVEIVEADFLQWQPGQHFDAVVMNPPFRTPTQPLAYLDHIQHALTMRSDTGLLVSVTPIGWQFTGNRKRLVQFREMVEERGFHRDLPDNAFAASGTNVRTCLVEFMD
jgi:phospholipid N-methyltransferase